MNPTYSANPHELSKLLGGPLPSDTDAEASLIASIIIDPTVLDQIGSKLKHTDFHDDAHRIIYRMMKTMHDADEPVGDIKLLLANLRTSGELPKVGDASYIAKLVDSVATSSAAAYLAEIIVETSRKRQLISNFCESLGRCYDQNDESSKIAQWMEAKINSLGVSDASSLVSLKEASQSLVNRISAAQTSQRKVGMPTGIPSLDADIGGLFRSDLLVVAARPSIGKTSLGIQFTKHVASKGYNALFVSLEMQDWELAGRIAASELNINFRLLRNGEISDQQLAEMQAYTLGLEELPFWLWRPRSATIEKIRAKAKMMKATVGLDFIAIDYLTKIAPTDSRVPRHEQIEYIVSASKNLAKELDVPVVMLAQAKRTEKNRRPRLDDLFGSSMIEADADVVLMIHREDRSSTEAIVGIEKNRNGATGDVKLGFRCNRTEFYDPNYEGYDAGTTGNGEEF